MLRKLLLTFAVLAVLGGGVGNTAQAGLSDKAGFIVNPIHKPVIKMTLNEKVKFYKANVFLAKHTLAWFKSQKGSWALDGLRYPAAYSLARGAIRYHRHLLKNATRNLKQVEEKIHELQVQALIGNANAWDCIHGGEGDWEDGGNPFWGGLQMDWGFIHTYGGDMIRKYGEPQGYAGANGWKNPWTPQEQMMVAERARASGRGYYPWPNTARDCGLI